ncbi:MAG: hypothetical protein J6X54_02300 [Treponema sp.]|nr:hypothetical protein [Treponema sp.]
MTKFKRVLSLFILAAIVTAFLSCNFGNTQPIKQYLNYWSEAVTIGRVEVTSETTVYKGQRNVSAIEPIKIQVLLINPNAYEIEIENPELAGFTIFKEDDESKKEIAKVKSAELSSDNTILTLSAKLPDKTEKQNLKLEGYFTFYKEEHGVSYAETKTYEYSFKQFSAPDKPRNLKNPEFADSTGYHCLYFDMPDTTYNRNKDLTYRIDCYERTSAQNCSFFATADVKADQSKATGKSGEFIYYFDEQEPSLQYEYVVTAISPEGVKSKTVSTSEALGLCYVTEPEIIFSSNGALNNLTAEKDANSDTYEVVEYTGDSFSLDIQKTDLTSELDVKLNGATAGTSITLQDGFNTIVATASKNRARPASVTKNLYVTKKLLDPDFTTNASKNGTKKVHGINYDIMQYSYLNSENCTYSIDNSVNEDSTITFTIDNTTAELSGTLDDGEHTLEINITKEHCQPLKIKKNFSVGIRQITAKLYKAQINISHNTKYKGKIQLYVLGGTKKDVRTYSSKDYSQNNYNEYGVPADYYLFFNSKSSSARFETFDSWAGYDPLRDVIKDFSLKDIKQTNGYLYIDSENNKKEDSNSSEDTYHKLWLSLSECAAPADIIFSPGLNGTVDSSNFEYIEVADSSSKASYTISAQGGASISGSIGNTTFTGSLSGELSVGEYTITVTSKQSGFNDMTITKKVKVLTPLSNPNIYVYATNTTTRIDTTESDAPVTSYTTYDLTLTNNGYGYASLEIAAGTGESVRVDDNDSDLNPDNSGKYKLELGPHNLNITVSKPGYKDIEIKKDIFIQGVLSEPDIVKITSTDIESGSGNTKADPRIIKFSYLTNETLKCRVQPGNKDNTVTVHKGKEDGDIIKDATTSFDAGCDTVQTLVIIQTRQYCKTKITTKYVKGQIKPITLHYRRTGPQIGNAYMVVGGYDGEGSFNLNGKIDLDSTTIWGWSSKNKLNKIGADGWINMASTENVDREYTRTFYSPSETIILHAIDMERRGGSCMSGDHNIEVSLRTIKATKNIPACGYQNKASARTTGGWTIWSGRLSDTYGKNNDQHHYVYVCVEFDVTEQ